MLLFRRILSAIMLIWVSLLLASCTHLASVDVPPNLTAMPSPSISPVPTPSPVASNTPTPVPTASPIAPNDEVITLNTSDYFPLDGEYLSYDTSQGVLEAYVEYYDQKNGLIQKRFIQDKKPSYVEVYSVESGGIRLLSRYDNINYTHNFMKVAKQKPNVDQILLAQPLAVGSSWEVEGGRCAIIALNKPIDLLMRSFEVVEVMTTNLDGTSIICQYASGIGLVSEYRFDDLEKITYSKSLASREKDRPSKQTIKFYFADQSKLDTKYILRTINIKPNTDMAKRISDELKKVPANSSLVPMPSGASILSIDPMYKNGIKVDVSSQFVSQMQVGRTGEKLRLQALANTFGDYYNLPNIYLTLQGNLYESPYFMLLNESEHLTMRTSSSKKYSS